MPIHAFVSVALLAQATPAPTPAPAPQEQIASAGPTLTLDEALQTAQAKNLDLKISRERLDQSKELSWKAWSGYLPQVTAGASFTHNNFSDSVIPANPAFGNAEPIVVAKQDQTAAQIKATQPIFAPQAWFGIASASAGERLAEANTESIRRDTLFGVAQAYYGAASRKQVVAIQERQLAIALRHEKDARVRFDAGTTPKVTLLRAEIDRSRAEQDLKRAQNDYVSSRVALATLLDRQDTRFEVTVPPPPQLPQGDTDALVGMATRDRPDIRAADEQVSVSERDRNGVVARYLPTLGAFGQYQYSNLAGFTGDTTTWAIGLQASWNILDGFLRESDLRERQSRVREAQVARVNVASKARQEVEQAQLDLDSAVANREKAKEQLSLAQENQRLVDVNYRAGAATYLEVSDANTSLLQAELTQISESLDADLAALRVLKAVGAFAAR
jgi:outer membrane protein TolC